MTKLVILQPGYLPWLGFFDQMNRADVFVYYDDVQFDKNGWRNRNRVKGPKGPVWLTIPVLHKGRSDQLINTVEVRNEQPWRAKHIRTIKELYAKAPFTKDYLGGLEESLSGPALLLADICYATTDFFRSVLGIDTPTYLSSELGITGDKSQRLINVCKHFDADTYLSGDAAQSYLDTEAFAAAGLTVQWQNYQHPVYDQFHDPFMSHLSIIDLIMHMGPDSKRILANA